VIRDATAADAPRLCEIYNHYVLHTTISFEEAPVRVETMQARLTGDDVQSWLVLEHRDEVVGFAFATTFKARSAYRFTVESSIYLDARATGGGRGSRLYAALLARLAGQGLHSSVACIALPNQVSVAFHEKLGFTKVAHFNEVGFKHDRWIDVGYWQLMFHPDGSESKPAR